MDCAMFVDKSTGSTYLICIIPSFAWAFFQYVIIRNEAAVKRWRQFFKLYNHTEVTPCMIRIWPSNIWKRRKNCIIKLFYDIHVCKEPREISRLSQRKSLTCMFSIGSDRDSGAHALWAQIADAWGKPAETFSAYAAIKQLSWEWMGCHDGKRYSLHFTVLQPSNSPALRLEE